MLQRMKLKEKGKGEKRIRKEREKKQTEWMNEDRWMKEG